MTMKGLPLPNGKNAKYDKINKIVDVMITDKMYSDLKEILKSDRPFEYGEVISIIMSRNKPFMAEAMLNNNILERVLEMEPDFANFDKEKTEKENMLNLVTKVGTYTIIRMFDLAILKGDIGILKRTDE